MIKPVLLPSLVLAVLASLGGCKFVKTDEAGRQTQAAAFDPDKAAQEMWGAKVLPYLQAKAGLLGEVQALAASDLKAAGEKYGNPRKQASSPWTFATKFEGTIVAANTQSRAATIDVDVNGDGTADARVQIGPAIRGTALRDSLAFVDFNQFINQIDFAQFGKALNTQANGTVLERLPRAGLVGSSAVVLGAYAAASGDALPLVTPAEVAVGAKP